MQRKLFLHIGSHRTATTSIQQFMFANFEALKKTGILYPMRVARHQRLINTIFAGKRNSAEVGQDLMERAAKHEAALGKPIGTVVLSDEDISMRRDLSPLAGLREHFDVQVVFSLRRQDLWLESWFFQNIKWQWIPHLSHCTFDEFLERREEFHWIRYNRYVQHLEDVFGAENIRLNVFEKQQMPDGPVVAFCKQIGLTDLSTCSTPPHVNSSMSAEMVEFLRHIPLDTFDPPERDLLRQAFEAVDRNVLGNTGKQSELLLSPDQRRAILAIYAEGNRALAQRHFNRDQLFLDPLPAEDAPLAQMTLPADTDTLLARFVAPLLTQLVKSGTISATRKK
ncbi:MAG: hypothetical protein QNJ09_01850 [Paracoccaceae bacterium]|nr:hypothetical protein [Paracoccaceae bacterium]